MAYEFVKTVMSQVCFYGFGFANLCLYLYLSLRRGSFKLKKTEQEQLKFAISRDAFWNLSKQPVPGFSHAFYTLRNGKKLHYITNRPFSSNKKDGNLLLMIHGFPDTCMSWRYLLREPNVPVQNARIIAVDLPGYGGSDGFQKHDTMVLEAVAEFIIAMREKHSEDHPSIADSNTIVFGHDWGCAIAFRLAVEAPTLADRFLLSNGPHVALALNNKDRMLTTAQRIVKQSNYSYGGFMKAYHVLKPLVTQVIMFGYIFAFNLPLIFVRILGTGGSQAFLRGIQAMAHHQNRDELDVQESLASVMGPGVIEVETKTSSGETYGSSVRDRSSSLGDVFISMTSYYRDKLAFQKWEKTLETIADLYNLESENSSNSSPVRRRSSSSASSTVFAGHAVEGSLKAPATIIWGELDKAVSRSVCFDGMSDYLAKGSEAIMLPRTGHWGPIEKRGRAVFAKAFSLYAGPQIPLYIADDLIEEYDGASCAIKK